MGLHYVFTLAELKKSPAGLKYALYSSFVYMDITSKLMFSLKPIEMLIYMDISAKTVDVVICIGALYL